MNANDVLRGYELHTAEGGRLTEEDAVIVAALKLKAAAESNDGTTPETDAVNDSMAGAQGWVTYTPMAPLARRLERERNGLAARVAEYESTDLCGPGGPCKALASSYAALAERDAELADERKRHDQTAKEGMDERDERKRLEAALAEAERKGREQGMREAVGIIQAEKVDADTTGEDADEAYNLAITHCTGAILSAIGEGK